MKSLIVRYLLVICITFLISIEVHSQSESFYNTINQFTQKIELTENIYKKLVINDSLSQYLLDFLDDSSTFLFTYDSIEFVGVLYSPDNQFKIFNWYVKLAADIYYYNAIIQYYDIKNNNYKVFILKDKSDKIENPENITCDDSTWFGALYYEIIPKQLPDKKVYTLLGFDFNSFASSKKIIDNLYFTNGEIKLGFPFYIEKELKFNRVIFEFSSSTVMTLKYDEKQDMIIFDHLSPSKRILEGHYEFYGPDFSYDGFKFENNNWVYKASIDARNPKKH